MLADLTIIPVGGGSHTGDLLAEIRRIVDSSGLRYQLTPTTTCIEGSWDEITRVARCCHEHAREKYSHVVTMLRLEDAEQDSGKLASNPAAAEQRAGRSFAQFPAEQPASSPQRRS